MGFFDLFFYVIFKDQKLNEVRDFSVQKWFPEYCYRSDTV